MTLPARQGKFSPGFPAIFSEVSENVSPCHVFGRFFPAPALISRHFARGGADTNRPGATRARRGTGLPASATKDQPQRHRDKDQPQRHRDTEKTQRKALVMLTAKRVSGTNLRFLCAFSVPLCLCGSNSSSWYDLPTSGPTAISLTDWLTDLLTHSLSHYPPYPLVRRARAHAAIISRSSPYDKNGVSFSSNKLGFAPGVPVGGCTRNEPTQASCTRPLSQ